MLDLVKAAARKRRKAAARKRRCAQNV